MYSYVQPHALEINPKVKLKGSKGQTLSLTGTYIHHQRGCSAQQQQEQKPLHHDGQPFCHPLIYEAIF